VECPASELWRFSPIKADRHHSRRRRSKSQSITIRVPFRFRVNGVDPQIYFERGYQVLIAFHPGRPEEGCHVFNAERGARNRDGLRFGGEDDPRALRRRMRRNSISVRTSASS